MDCQQVAKLIIPDSVTHIGAYAFAHCSSLTSLTIPNSVTQIGNNAFDNCRKLARLSIPDTVTHIGTHAFGGCHSLVWRVSFICQLQTYHRRVLLSQSVSTAGFGQDLSNVG